MKNIGLLALLCTSLAGAQGYDTSCVVDVTGTLRCNTRPDGLMMLEQMNRQNEQHLRTLPDPFAMPDQGGPLPMPGVSQGSIGGAEATRYLQQLNAERQLQIQQQQLELQRQQLEWMRQQQGRTPQQQLQSGVLKTTRQDGGKLLCYYVPASGKKFSIQGAPQDGIWYQAQAGRCGQQLKMASDGRGWLY